MIVAGSIGALLPLIIISGLPNHVSSLTINDIENSGDRSDTLQNLQSEPQVVFRAPKLYVIWSEYFAGSREIFFKRSLDNGQSFGLPINLSNTTGDSFSPSIYVFENFVKVSWIEEIQSAERIQNFTHLQRTSTDYGLIFGPTIDLNAPPPKTTAVNDARRTLIDDVFARSINSSQTLFFIKSGGVYEDGQRQPSLRMDITIPTSTSNGFSENADRIRFQYFAYVNDGSTIGSQCSDVRVHLYVDGKPVGSTEWVGYEGRESPLPLDTGIVELENTTPLMQHTLTLIPEGRIGGCNVGWINAWGGFVVLYH